MCLQQTTVARDCDVWENKMATWFFEKRSARDPIGVAAVGIAKKHKQNVENVATTRFVVVVVMRFGSMRIAVASIYLPVRMQNLDEVQERLSFVTEATQQYNPDIVMCAGDFNCGLGNYVDMRGIRWSEERMGCRHTDVVSDWITSMGLRAHTNSVKEDSWTRSTWSWLRKRTQIDFWLTKGADRKTFTTLPQLPTVHSDHCLPMMGWTAALPGTSRISTRTSRSTRIDEDQVEGWNKE